MVRPCSPRRRRVGEITSPVPPCVVRTEARRLVGSVAMTLGTAAGLAGVGAALYLGLPPGALSLALGGALLGKLLCAGVIYSAVGIADTARVTRCGEVSIDRARR